MFFIKNYYEILNFKYKGLLEILINVCKLYRDDQSYENYKNNICDCTKIIKDKIDKYSGKIYSDFNSNKTYKNKINSYKDAISIYKEFDKILSAYKSVYRLEYFKRLKIENILNNQNNEGKFIEGGYKEKNNLNNLIEIEKDLNETINDHNKEELFKKQNLDLYKGILKKYVPEVVSVISEKDGYPIELKIGEKTIGHYHMPGCFYLNDFKFSIKINDFKNYYDKAQGLKIENKNNKNFKTGKILIAFDFWTRCSIDAETVTILLDLKNGKIFGYENEKIYCLAYNRSTNNLNIGENINRQKEEYKWWNDEKGKEENTHDQSFQKFCKLIKDNKFDLNYVYDNIQ